MPLDVHVRIMAQMRRAGYRLSRLRPFADHSRIRVAAVWVRDGVEWACETGLTPSEVTQRHQSMRAEGFEACDVAGYLEEGATTTDRYAVVWSKATAKTGPTELLVGLSDQEFPQKQQLLHGDGFAELQTVQYFRSASGYPKYCGIAVQQDGGDTIERNQHALEFEKPLLPGIVLWDLDLARTERPPSTKERYAKQLEAAIQQLETNPNDSALLFSQAQALYHLSRNEEAEEVFNKLVEKSPDDILNYMYLVVAQARLSKSNEALESLSRIRDLKGDGPVAVLPRDGNQHLSWRSGTGLREAERVCRG